MKAKFDEVGRLCLTAETCEDKQFIEKAWNKGLFTQTVNSSFTELKIQIGESESSSVEEMTITTNRVDCPVCGTTEWTSIRCVCHRVCKNGHKFRVEGL